MATQASATREKDCRRAVCADDSQVFPDGKCVFTSLGYNVLLTKPTNEETIRLSQENARGETCYPVKLIYGHMKQLIDAKVDYIFLPTIHTMKHELSHVEHNYGCVYMQTAAVSIGKELGLEEKGITLLSPVFDLDFGKEAMASAMVGLGKILGISMPFVQKHFYRVRWQCESTQMLWKSRESNC